MTDLPDFTTVDAADDAEVVHVVVVDHPDGTYVYGATVDGTPATRRFSASGNLPWGAVLGLATEHSIWRAGEPGLQDSEPETGFPRFTFPAIPR